MQLTRLSRLPASQRDSRAEALGAGARATNGSDDGCSRRAEAQPGQAPATEDVELVALPSELYLESTNRCNELCDQCPRTHLKREPDRDLSLAEVEQITAQLPQLERVVLHGLGEPLLNPELPAIVAHLRQRGAYVLFNSNATALSERVGRALIDADLNELRVSLDGATPGTYARVRGVNERTLPKIIRNLATLYPAFSVNCTPSDRACRSGSRRCARTCMNCRGWWILLWRQACARSMCSG